MQKKDEAHGCFIRSGLLMADILVPQFRVIGDELPHHADAGRILHHLNFDSAVVEQLLFAEERLVLPDNDARDPIQQNRAATHRAGRKRGVERRFAIDGSGQATGVLERIHLAVQNGAPALDSAVMSTAQDAPVMYQNRPNGNAAFAKSLFGFLDGSFEKPVRLHSTEVPITMPIFRPSGSIIGVWDAFFFSMTACGTRVWR